MRLLLSFGMLLASLFLEATSQAQDSSDVQQALEQLGNALRNDESLDPATRKALSNLVEALKAERERRSPPVASSPSSITTRDVAPAVDEYLDSIESPEKETGVRPLKDRLKFSGDFRLRHESFVNQDTRTDRHRERIRLRVGGTYEVNSQLTFGARIITGDPDDPQSANQTLGNVFDSFRVSLDRVYVTYEPDWAPNTWLTAGKFAYPLMRNPVFGQLLYDSDVQPEGFVLGHTFENIGRLEDFTLIASEFLVSERTLADDAIALVLQVSGKLRLAEDWTAQGSLGYFLYSNVDSTGTGGFALADNAGNAAFDSDGDGKPDKFVSQFEILNPMVALTWDGWRMPLTISAEYIKNFEANIAEDTGIAVGVSLGQTKEKGDWRVYYQYQIVEQDAVFSPVAQDEFIFFTNFRGHVVGTQYQLSKQIQLRGTVFVTQRDEPIAALGQTDQNQWKLRGDMIIKF